MTERILTLHPRGKKGVNIELSRYEVIKDTILRCVSNDEMTASEIFSCAEKALGDSFDGSVSWYAETVKLDLEARGHLKRVKSGSRTVYVRSGKDHD
jgi:hypothetical protein